MVSNCEPIPNFPVVTITCLFNGVLQNLDCGLWTGVLTTFTRFLSPLGCLNQASNLEGPGISFIAGSSYLELVSETTKNNLGHSMVRLLSPEHI